MHLKTKNIKTLLIEHKPLDYQQLTETMASSLVNDDEDHDSTTARTTHFQQQQNQQQQNNSNNINNNNKNNINNNTRNGDIAKLTESDIKLRKQALEQRKQDLEKLLNEKSWLLQQIQKQEVEILNGNFEHLNLNDLIQTLTSQYKHEQSLKQTDSAVICGGVVLEEDGIQLRHKAVIVKENQVNNNNFNNSNILANRQSDISNRSSEYDNFPNVETQSTHSAGKATCGGGGGGGGASFGSSHTLVQFPLKAALKKRSATVAGSIVTTNQQLLRQQQQQQQQQKHFEQQAQQHLMLKQQQLNNYALQQQQRQQQYMGHHQVLVPHLQYATQKFYYTTLHPQVQAQAQAQAQSQTGRYIQSPALQQQQQQQQQQQPQSYITTPLTYVDNISLYSVNSTNVATLRHHQQQPQQQQQPLILQCDKYYLSPTFEPSQSDGGGFIKASQNIKEYSSPHTHISPQQHSNKTKTQGSINIRDKNRLVPLPNQQMMNRIAPSLDVISLTPSYVSMEEVDYTSIVPAIPVAAVDTSTPLASSNMQWHLQNSNSNSNNSNLLPTQTVKNSTNISQDTKFMHAANNHQYYTTAFQPPPHPVSCSETLNAASASFSNNNNNLTIASSNAELQTKKLQQKPKQWLESSLDGPAIRHSHYSTNNNTNNDEQNAHTTHNKLSSQSMHTTITTRHYSMSADSQRPTIINSTVARSLKTSLANPTKVVNNDNDYHHHHHHHYGGKLSQSATHLNHMVSRTVTNATTAAPTKASFLSSPQYIMEDNSVTDNMANITAYKYLPKQMKTIAPKTAYSSTSTALFVNTNTTTTASGATNTSTPTILSPEIRIESPKNVTIVQPATFQPYKEVIKPFEMSDFYKYSTKFRQKGNQNTISHQENTN